MKNVMKWMFGVALLTIGMSFSFIHTSKAQSGGAVSYQTFYDDLSPYGDWIYDPDYGYVWSPQAGNDFRPYYTNGRWAMTEYGNTWVSGYPWGWAPFHYGRWTYNRFYGWVWIPGTTWGPAWVSWRYGGGNYGWAPMGPGISINISFGNNYYVPYDWWTFVPCGNIYNGYYNNYWRGAGYNNTYINNTVIINNTYNNTYVYGPRRNEIEQVTGGRVNVYNIREGRNAGRNTISGNNVNIYRPTVRTASGNRNEAPRNFVKATNDKSIRTAAPALTGRTAMERNQRELKTTPVRNSSADRNSVIKNADRNNAPRSNDRKIEKANATGRQVERATDTRVQPNARNERIQEMNNERMQREQERAQQTQLREQQIQTERRQRAQQEQQLQIQRQQERTQQRQIREQQIQQRPVQQTPQREWRRPEPQRVERAQPARIERQQPQMQRSQPARIERSQPVQRQSAPAQRGGGGFERGGRR